ncbi:MAG: AI-2E family transporter [Pseudomonadota bacterium]
MALPVRDQVTYWSIAAVLLMGLLWVLGDVLLPFVLGGAIAYCLDPVADRLERIGLSRMIATVVITVFGLLLFVLLALLVIPTLVQQAIELVDIAPTLLQNFQMFLAERFPSLLEPESTMRKSLQDIIDTLQARGGELVNTVLSGAMSFLNVIVLVVLVPVVTFYLLLDWDNLVARIDSLLPRDHAPTLRQIASDIDRTLASFIRGQGTVCVILGTYYAVALMLVGLQFGLVVGFVAGLITFIPYVGALFGGALAIGLALFQFWGEWGWIAAVAAIFMAGQFIEGNILTPNLVGQSVGLHPVWLIFALSVFGSIFGFVGMLVAVPLAAMIGVVARFMIGQYKAGLLYNGVAGVPPPDDPADDDKTA